MDSKRQLEEENKSLKIELERYKEELTNKSERIDILEASISKMGELSKEMLSSQASKSRCILFSLKSNGTNSNWEE
jgi:sugar-specific transcriptional regulator TrmB